MNPRLESAGADHPPGIMDGVEGDGRTLIQKIGVGNLKWGI